MTMSTHFVGYDIIGDIHGCADALERLLSALGYIKSLNGYVYHDPDKPRQVVFLGDILDRGPKIRQAVQIVRAMVDNGQAQIVMGNHEYNALSCTAGVHADATHSDPLTVHRGHACYNVLIQKTIEQYADYVDEWIDTLQWLYTLPLFLEFEHFRVVHACWDQALVDQFRDRYGRATVDAAFVLEAQQSGSFAHQVVNRLMRGISLRLPDNMTITSSEGFVRRNFRVKFWEAEPVYYGDVEFQPDHLSE
jgi:hypothetical protein